MTEMVSPLPICNLVLAKGLIATTTYDKMGHEVIQVDCAAVGPGLATLLAGVVCGGVGASIWWLAIIAFVL